MGKLNEKDNVISMLSGFGRHRLCNLLEAIKD